jgi:predicted protein tyrosine phosphatase
MDIKIFSLKDLEEFLLTHKKEYAVIQYTPSPRHVSPFVLTEATEYVHLPVDDMDHYEFKQHNPPDAKDVKACLDFGRDKRKLVVSCSAGISRSSATAYLIASEAFGPGKALNLLQNKHQPNRLIVYIGSKLLGEETIWTKYVDWMRKWQYLDPSQDGKWPSSKLISEIGFDKV